MPEFLTTIKEGVYEYDDKILRFIKKSMKQVPYLAQIVNYTDQEKDTEKKECIHEIIYSLNTQKKGKGEILQKVADDAKELYFLQSGCIEVFTKFEGKEFVIERLFRGSIINYRTFFMEYKAVCEMRFAEASVLKALHKDKFEQICEAYPKTLGKNFNSYKLKIVKEQKTIPLDYIMVLPPAVQKKIQS